MRQESDFLGSKDLPDNAYWGVHAARAVENFPITGHTVAQMPNLIRAFAYVKKAAAAANLAMGAINAQQAEAISKACDDVAAGKFNDQFVDASADRASVYHHTGRQYYVGARYNF